MPKKPAHIRKPIVLTNQVVALLHIFRGGMDLDDMWAHDLTRYSEVNATQYKKSADELLNQLGDFVTPAFMEELIKGAFEKMREHKGLSTHAVELLDELVEFYKKETISLADKCNEEVFREIVEQAHMAGQADAGVDASYSSARAYFNTKVKKKII